MGSKDNQITHSEHLCVVAMCQVLRQIRGRKQAASELDAWSPPAHMA